MQKKCKKPAKSPSEVSTRCATKRPVGGKRYYFGVWDEPAAALEKYLPTKDQILGGYFGIQAPAGIHLADAANHFLTWKHTAASSGEITKRTFEDYRDCYARFLSFFGRTRPLELLDLSPEWANYRAHLAKTLGITSLRNQIMRLRVFVRFAVQTGPG